MPGVKRGLFAVVSALSLLLCVAACVFWARRNWWYCASYTTHAADASRRSYGAAAFDGEFRLFKIWGISGRQPGFEVDHYRYVSNDMEFRLANRKWSFAGFRWYAYSLPFGRHGRVTDACCEMPFWCIGLISLAAPAIWTVRRCRRRRVREGEAICLRCGYDVRASKLRCPECGTPIPLNDAATAGLGASIRDAT